MNITHESLYAAWHKVGADVAGLKWSDFVAAIEAQPATQQPPGEPVAFVIFDEQGEPHHVTAYRQAAHEHINDAIAKHGLTEASGWVVRPVYATTQPRKPLTDERIC